MANAIANIRLLLKKYWRVLTILLLVAITCLSLLPLPQLPEVPGKDKTFHFIAYATLAFPASWAMPRRVVLVLLFFILYSGALELLQPYVNRYASWLDFAANSTGVVIGFLLAKVVSSQIKRRKE